MTKEQKSNKEKKKKPALSKKEKKAAKKAKKKSGNRDIVHESIHGRDWARPMISQRIYMVSAIDMRGQVSSHLFLILIKSSWTGSEDGAI